MKINGIISQADNRSWENTYCRSAADKKRCHLLSPILVEEKKLEPKQTSNNNDLIDITLNNPVISYQGRIGTFDSDYSDVEKIDNLSLDRSSHSTTNEMDVVTHLQCKKKNPERTKIFANTTDELRSPTSQNHSLSNYATSSRRRYRSISHHRGAWYLLPGLKSTSCLTIVLLVFLETVLLSTVSNCAKTFYMHWNTTNSIFRIDNTDHIIDVNKGNLQFEYDQVHIICPVYEPGTFENETEKYIIYNVSKVEYETCRITNANPRIIAICDKPQKLMFFTITFRPFTPQPGGLEFLPGNDYYFISTSSKDDLHRRIGGRCSTNNMKVVFKVCCVAEEKTSSAANQLPNNNQTQIQSQQPVMGNGGNGNTGVSINQPNQMEPNQQQPTPSQNNRQQISKVPFSYNNNNNNHNNNNNNNNGGINGNNVYPPVDNNQSNIVHSTVNWSNGANSNAGNGMSNGGNTVTSSSMNHQQLYPYLPSTQRPYLNRDNNRDYDRDLSNSNVHMNNNNQSPSHNNNKNKKTNDYDKLPNEVVKNEELTYNSNSGSNRLVRLYKYSRHPNIDMWQLLFSSNSLLINLLYTIIIANSFSSVLKQISNFFNDLDISQPFFNVNNNIILSKDDDNKHCDVSLPKNSVLFNGFSTNSVTSENIFKFKQKKFVGEYITSVRKSLKQNEIVNNKTNFKEEIKVMCER